MGGSGRGSVGLAVADWRAAGRVLRERAEMTLALGACLEGLPNGVGLSPEGLADRLQEIVGGLLAKGTPMAGGEAVARGATEPPTKARPAGEDREPGTALRALQTDLSGRAWPVMWFASAGPGAERVTLALGMRGDGSKKVVGLWPGSSGEQRLGQNAAADLWARGLNRGIPWLAVTGAERALGAALGQRWGNRLWLVHDQREVAGAVLAHLPAAAREAGERALRNAWEAPEVAMAHTALERLAESWHGTYPGAAARLRQEIEPSTTVQALCIHGPLGQRLRTTTPAEYLLAQCLPAGRGREGRAWLGAIAAELLRRQAAFRRLPEHDQLPALSQRLEAQRGATAVAG
jgi:hypothetical protein